MRPHRVPLCTTAFTALALSVTGCGSDQRTDPGVQSAVSQLLRPTTTSAAADAPCVVGNWRSDEYSVDGAGTKSAGGSGVRMAVAPDGRAEVNFAGMQKVTITVTSTNQTYTESYLTYSGTVSGKLKLPPADASSGPWAPEPGINWLFAHITLDSTGGKVFTDVPLGDITGSGAAEHNTQPLLGSGKYTCSGKNLTVEQPAGANSATWSLHREDA
jgi:hypothetical protein